MTRERTMDVIGLVARLVIGGALIAAGALKLGHPLVSARAVQAYQILPFDVAAYVGYALPVIEVVIGAVLIVGLFTRAAALVGLILMVIFIAGIISVWVRGISIDCGCFGGGGAIDAAQTEYPLEIARDTLFGLAAAWLVRRPRSVLSLDAALGHRS